MSEEQVVENQPAPVEGQAAQADVQNASVQAQPVTQNAPTPKGDADAQPDLDYRKSYEELRPQYTKTTQELSNIRKRYEETAKQLSELHLSQKQMAELLAKATERQISPDEFLKDLQTQGPKALDAYFDKRFQAVREETLLLNHSLKR
jgi:hypothetical protein